MKQINEEEYISVGDADFELKMFCRENGFRHQRNWTEACKQRKEAFYICNKENGITFTLDYYPSKKNEFILVKIKHRNYLPEFTHNRHIKEENHYPLCRPIEIIFKEILQDMEKFQEKHNQKVKEVKE